MSWFTLELSDKGLLDRDLDMLEAGVDSFLINILLVFKKWGRQPQVNVLKTSWRHVLKTSSACQFLIFQDFLKKSWRLLGRRLEDVFAIHLEVVLEGKKLLHWRRLQDVFKTS